MRVKIGIVGIVIIIASIFIWYFMFNNVQEDTVLTTTKETTVKKADLVIDFLADGIVTMETFELSFKSTGIVSEVHVDLGDEVNEDQSLAVLDTQEVELKIKQNELDLLRAEEKIETDALSLTNDIRYQSAELNNLYNDLNTEKENLVNMEAYTLLYTQNDYDTQQEKIDNIYAQIILEQLKLEEFNSKESSNDYLELEDIELSKQLLELELESSKLLSPSDGVVVKINGYIGEAFGTSSSFITIQKQSNPTIKSMVSELDVHQLFEGQKVLVEFESEFGREFEGAIQSISMVPNIDNNGIVTYETEIQLIEYPETLRAGLTTLLRFVLKERQDALMIPNTAVTIIDNQQKVEVKSETGTEMRDIVTGLTDGLNVEVIDGLSQGDVVVIRIEN